MADPLTAGALVVLAAQKFVESSAGELAKKFMTEAIAKISELWQQFENRYICSQSIASLVNRRNQ